MLKGFRDFISRGNVVDLAVGVIIGGAFTPIVTAVSDKFLMAIIAGIVGKPNFDNVLEFHVGGSLVQPGAIISAVVNFLIVAAALYFAVVVPMNKLREFQEAHKAKPEAEEAAPEVPADVVLLTEIRDLLEAQKQS